MPVITKQNFFDKSLDEMIRTLYEYGTFIVSIRYYRYKINLYLILHHCKEKGLLYMECYSKST